MNRHQKHGLACKLCRPTPPSERARSTAATQAAALRRFTCGSCEVEKPRGDFWPNDIINRYQKQGLTCKICRPTPPSERPRNAAATQTAAARCFTCGSCDMDKPRDDFWPSDIINRHQKQGLACKICRPTPPSERRAQKRKLPTGEATQCLKQPMCD